jgi:hypothetical protein
VTARRLDLVVGGSWHDFAGFARTVTDVLRDLDFSVHESFSLGTLKELARLESKVVVLYTCLDEQASLTHDATELAALSEWVRAGGGLLALHSTAVAARTQPELKALIGGSFVSHPPKGRFLAAPMLGQHPITAGIEAFQVEDELYTLDYDPGVTILLVTLSSGRAHPLVWTRKDGKGRIVYIALGHDETTWNLPNFRRLLVQTVMYLTRS